MIHISKTTENDLILHKCDYHCNKNVRKVQNRIIVLLLDI